MNGRWLGFCLFIGVLPGSVVAESIDMPRSDEVTDYLSPKTMAEARPQWRPARGQAGAAWAGFLEWPSLTAGLLIDSNPLQSHEAHGVETGARLGSQLVVERESGVHDTVLYGHADARAYAALSRADQFEGRAGLLHDWAITRSLLVRGQVDLSQSIDRIDSREVVTGRAGGAPFQKREAAISGSIQKTFDQLFASISGKLVASRFEDAGMVRSTSGAVALSSQTAFTVKGRVGYWLGPALFTFAEPSANWRVLDAVDQRSSGTRIVGGVGTDRISLFSGEVYGGVQQQTFERPSSKVSEPLVGGALTWRPDSGWTIVARVDRQLEQAAVGTAAEPLGTPVDMRNASLTVDYAPGACWSIEGTLQREALNYVGKGRRDTLTALDASLAYQWRHDLELTADLRLTRVASTRALAAYDRAMATLGAVYRY